MALPPLLKLPTPEAYRDHYFSAYCRSAIHTFDGIRVYFSQSRFGHAFYETVRGGEYKSTFNLARGERMDWIKATLENPKAELYQGWDKYSKAHDPRRRVSVVYEDFVVVIEILRTATGLLKANFVTAFSAGLDIEKIRSGPRWTP